jgi:hypothetical protein
MARLDRNELGAVPPGDVERYLAAHGWRREESEGLSAFWTRASAGTDLEVQLPVNNELRDYPARLAELLGTLTELEDRPREDILRDLRNARVDVQHIRLLPNAPSGTTPLHEGFVAIRGVHDLFLAAATSAVLRTPTPVLPSQKPPEAWQFLRGVRLGQTSVGSYVLRIETPLADNISAQVHPTVEPVSSRTVLTQLHRAVQAAQSAAGSEQVSEFEAQSAAGVSANLCKALADIGGVQRSPFEITFAWAPAAPLDLPTPDIRFDRHMISRLKDASEHLRTLLIAEDARVEGRVVELRRESLDAPGAAVIEGSVQGHVSRDKVIVHLDLGDYETALQVHRTDGALVVRGRLVRSGSHLELIDGQLINPEG